MAASKARFAFFVVISIISCLLALLNFLSGSIFFEIVSVALSLINEVAGYEIVRNIPPGPPTLYGILGAILALAAIVAIWRFSDKALHQWDAPATITVSELAKKNRENNLFSLAIAEAIRLAKGQNDLIASDAALNWTQRVSEAPPAPNWNNLAKNLLCGAFSEIRIEDNGWRDRISAWIGTIYLNSDHRKQDVYLLTFHSEYEIVFVKNRISDVIKEGYDIKNYRFFAIFNTKNYIKENIDIDGLKVEIWSRSALLREGLSFVEYARDIIRRFDYEPLGGTQATLSQTYVSAHVVRSDRSEGRFNLENIYTAWINESSRRHLAIVGEYGQGKSTAMLALCVEWARGYIRGEVSSSLVPLLIELRGQSPAETDPASFLAPWASRFGLDARRIYNLIQAGEVVLIFEGFDELRNAGRAYDRHEHFNALWRLAYPGAKLIFTGRPNFFIDEAEKNRTLRFDQSKGAAGNAYTDLWEIDRLRPDEVKIALSGFDRDLAESVIAAATEYTSFRDIVSRPSMLPVVATIWPEIENLQKQGQRLTDAILIERYLDAAYQRKETEIENYQRITGAPVGATYLLLPRDLRETFTSLIVWDMVSRDARNTITRARFQKVIFDNIRTVFSIYQTVGSKPHVVEAIRRLEERYRDHNPQDLPEMLANEIASAGLFVSDPVGGVSNLRLPHKQYYEYVIAKTAFEATKADNKIRKILVDKARNDGFLARHVLREPNAIYYYSGICGADFDWFKTYSVKLLIIVNIISVYISLGMRFIFNTFSNRVKISGAFVEFTLGEVLEPLLIYVRKNPLTSLIYAGLLAGFSGVITATVTAQALDPDKLFKVFAVMFIWAFITIVLGWVLAPSLPKSLLLELIARYRMFECGERPWYAVPISDRLSALREAFNKLR